MNNITIKLKEFINRTFVRINHYSLEKIISELDDEVRRTYFEKYIKKGIPAFRIFKMLSKREDIDLAEIVSDSYNLPIKERKKASNLFVYLALIDNAIEAFLKFLRGLRLRIYTMNLLLAIVYSIFPWLTAFANNSYNFINETHGVLAPSIYTIIFFALLLLLISFLMSITFLEIKIAVIQLILVITIYFVFQIILSTLFSSFDEVIYLNLKRFR